MDVNKIKILQKPGDKNIVVPLGNEEDFLDREGAIIQEETKIIQDVIGSPTDYELVRYSNAPDSLGFTQLDYNFYFTDSPSNPATTSYLSKFTETQIRYKTNQFRSSFFKLDFYDSPDPKKQKNYFTIILPTTKSLEVIENTCEAYIITIKKSGRLIYTNCCGDLVNQTAPVSPTQSSAPFGVCRTAGTPIIYKYSQLRTDGDGNGTSISYTIDIDVDGLTSSNVYSVQNQGNCNCNSLISAP